MTRHAVMGLVRILGPLLFDLQVFGPGNLPPEGPCIVTANHINVLDVFPLQLALPRPILFMAKAELHRSLLLDMLLRRLGSFPVERGQRDRWAIEHAEGLLDRGRVLGMFPEGTRSHGVGLAPAKSGAARLAISRQVPIVPIGISGVEGPLGVGPSRMSIHVRLGPPLWARTNEDPVELTDRMMYHISALLPEALRGAYATAPPGFPELQAILRNGSGAPTRGQADST
jgi:1-acyl-sn-glycerol-3-phosphate acyltransferase